MRTINFIYIYTLLAGLPFAQASDAHGEHGPVAVPWQMVYPQLFNFAIFLGLLVFFLRKQVVQYFINRRDQFTAAERHAKAAREQAAKDKAEITERLERLNREAGDTEARARAEAELLKQQILGEAEKLSRTLREEAERTARYEIERAKTELRAELVNQSMQTARTILGERLNEPDQRRLQTESVDKIQVVR